LIGNFLNKFNGFNSGTQSNYDQALNSPAPYTNTLGRVNAYIEESARESREQQQPEKDALKLQTLYSTIE